jgi:hypothetical protein
MDIILDKYFNKSHLFVINEASSDKVSIARYILTPDIFDILRSGPTDASGEVMLADAINIHPGCTRCLAQAIQPDQASSHPKHETTPP